MVINATFNNISVISWRQFSGGRTPPTCKRAVSLLKLVTNCNVEKVSSVHLHQYPFLLNLHVVPKYYDSHRDGHVSKLSLTSRITYKAR